ncbi:nucleoside/nucleotide kinase family protein [Nocardioides mesophilus]|uniref:Nucleoside/nucleotide kinase family protein n=2 Tax=Nocardioides mesophilus TaxID=433659 RepID=A0A7G9RH41_9ACTN|nr:nucleoside/nucleotide kinase family protein [Nocardioides mesophilus]QNN54916.1 nucleoside/nucleotide kinase family protein [Nocardioides mesophilus]
MLAEAVRRARGLVAPGTRRLLGIVGPPGGGKSTLAHFLTEQLGTSACYVPMDGFHLANVELERLARRDRKGAPDTFDAAGYVALLRRLRDAEETVYAPAFDRELDESIAGAVAVPPTVPLVITEGNYLLLQEGPWADVRRLLDEIWYVETDEQTRVERLIQRHVTFGKTPAAAHAWAHGSDQRNAELVARSRHGADLVVHLSPRDREAHVASERTPADQVAHPHRNTANRGAPDA